MPAPPLLDDWYRLPAAAALVGGCAFAVLVILSAMNSIKVLAML
jgi:hypothetical protein